MNRHTFPATEQDARPLTPSPQNRTLRALLAAAITVIAAMALTIAYLLGRSAAPPPVAPALPVAAASSFRADMCGAWPINPEDKCLFAAQTGFDTQHYNRVIWTSLYRASERDRFFESYWMPVKAGEKVRNIQFAGQLLIIGKPATPGIPSNYVARIWKNGRSARTLGAKIGMPAPQFGPNVFIVSLDMQDVAGPGDVYEVRLFAPHADAIIDNHPLHTWWSGQ